jgi:aspartyl-tRNA(Asn)/glutamyl-tRNA(Gln) amidotransferase subunit C
MQITKDTIAKIAHLSRLEVDEKQAESMSASLTDILNWVEKLNELDTEHVAPLFTMSEEVNVLREDEIGEHLPHDRALKLAPKKDSDYFRVPKVLE